MDSLFIYIVTQFNKLDNSYKKSIIEFEQEHNN